MLYYKDTKLRSRRRSREGHVYIYSAKIPLTRTPILVVYNGAMISYRGSTPVPLHHPPFLKKPALRLYPLVKRKEEKKKKSSIWRLIAMLVNIGLIAVLQLLLL